MRTVAKSALGAAALALLLAAHAAAARIRSEPGVYTVSVQPVKVDGQHLHITYVRPVVPQHPKYLIVFTTGDGGWHGVSNKIVEHLAAQSYSIAGLSAPDLLRPLKRARRKLSAAQASALLGAAFARFRKDLAVAPSTRLIAVGFSRGATFVAFTAIHPELQADLAGVIAIGLTRQADYLRSIAPRTHGRKTRLGKKKGKGRKGRRGLIYPALKRFARVPVAVIQSTGDRYVHAADSRRLLGPDTPERRLYTVDARNHRFGGGREQLMRDLDAALQWIEQP